MEVEQRKSAFETHVIVEPCDQGLLFAFVKELSYPGLIQARATCAQTFYGQHPVQPMLTYWYVGLESDATLLAMSMSTNMTAFGMTVKRVKVEASLSGHQVPEEATGCHYFEFHFKVDTPDNNSWNRLANVCAKFAAHLFYNPYSKTGTMMPVVTLRRYSTSKQAAVGELDELMKTIKSEGFQIVVGTEREYSVLDTNVHLDDGWLFTGEPEKFLTYVPTPIPTLSC